MADPRDRRPDWGPRARMVADGMLAATDRVMDQAAKTMLKDVSRGARLVLKRIPGAPGLVVDAVEFAGAQDRGRKLAGMAGSALGAAGGGALGMAAGPAAPVAAPLAAAAGSLAGEHIAEEFYDKHADNIGRWMRERNEQVARNPLNDLQRHTRPPQFRERF